MATLELLRGRVYEIIEETKGVMNVFAGERIVESYLFGAVGYVNPYGNYIPRASYRICDFIVAGRLEEAKKIERLINKMQAIINEGHPTYGHQCYSKALAAVAGIMVAEMIVVLTGRVRRDAPLPERSRLHRTSGFGPPVREELLFDVVDVLFELADETGRRRCRGEQRQQR